MEKFWNKGDKFEYTNDEHHNYGTVYEILKIVKDENDYRDSWVFARALTPKRYKRDYNRIKIRLWVLILKKCIKKVRGGLKNGEGL